MLRTISLLECRRPSPLLQPSARTTHRVHASDISKTLCHRLHNGKEQYLVLWKTDNYPIVPPRAICSWHGLEELQDALHHVQTYLEAHSLSRPTIISTGNGVTSAPNPRKRKSPSSDAVLSRDSSRDFTPQDSAKSIFSREPSVISIGSSSSGVGNEAPAQRPEVYNGVLQRKEGRILAKKSRDPAVVQINVTRLPNNDMLEAAATAPTSAAEHMIREAFTQKLKPVKKVRWENQIDGTAPSLDFTFVREFVLREGVYKAPPHASEGCSKPCRPNMGQNIGCEYPKVCSCLEYAAVNEPQLERDEPKLHAEYLRRKEAGYFADMSDMPEGKLPKRFPYQKPSLDARVPSTLLPFYLDERYPIYECNVNCKCGPGCKSRVVQKGRKVPLTIFKTPDNRGWGVYCDEELIRGEFVDTYIGEVITNKEADIREAKAGKDKASYLYNLDKFVGDVEGLTEDTCYIVDGQYMGGPTRFINHSCEPNCRQYTVSYNKNDPYVYDLAFFAIEDIPAGTELTFDYMDKDEEEEEEVLRAREAAARNPKNLDKKPCSCGAKKCRGFLWT